MGFLFYFGRLFPFYSIQTNWPRVTLVKQDIFLGRLTSAQR